jgi:hypothetical protein
MFSLQQVPAIGPSSGWLRAKISNDFEHHWDVIRDSGATAGEIVWSSMKHSESILNAKVDLELLQYCSLHLCSFKEFAPNLTEIQFKMLQDIQAICQRYGIKAATLHPDQTPSHIYSVLKERRIPIGIENMDRCKGVGKTPCDIEALLKANLVFGVLDLQHLYEVAKDSNCSFFELAKDFTRIMLDNGGIAHLHVSGEITENNTQVNSHALLSDSTNKDEVLNAIRIVYEVADRALPIILEGDPLPQYSCLADNDLLSCEHIEFRKHQAVCSILSEIELIMSSLH